MHACHIIREELELPPVTLFLCRRKEIADPGARVGLSGAFK